MSDIVTKPQRYKWIDIAKGIGIILVVIGHCNPPEWLKSFISAFHMPLFFFVSGFVFKPSTEEKYMTRLKKDFLRLVVPYILTVVIVGIFLLIIQSQGKKGYYASIEDLGASALFGSGSGYNGTKLIGEIWFLLAMFWARRIMDVVFLFRSDSHRFVIVAVFVGVSIALASVKKWVPMNIDIAFLSTGFMYAGYLAKSNQKIAKNKMLTLFFVMVAAVSLSTSSFAMSSRKYFDLWFVSLPGAIALSAMTCKLSMKIELTKVGGSFLSFVGKHSLLFMCVHSIDWRMPFPKFGQSVISSLSSYNWYWCVSSLHRFVFDLLITAAALVLVKLLCRYLPPFRHYSQHRQ